MDKRLRVDWIRCDGYGLCGDLLPEVIDLDEWRYPIIRPGPVDHRFLTEAQRAVDCCPMKALILEPVPADRRAQAADRAIARSAGWGPAGRSR